MKKLFLILMVIFFMISVSVYAKPVILTLGWVRNTEPDLAGYKLYQSDVSGDYSGCIPIEIMGNPNQYTLQIEMEHAIPTHLVLTAFDTSNLESDYSNQVFHVIYIDSNAPSVPQIFNIKNYIIIQ